MVDAGHWSLPAAPEVIRATTTFLAQGRFAASDAARIKPLESGVSHA